MIKIKINIKGPSAYSTNEFKKASSSELKKVIPYDEEDDHLLDYKSDDKKINPKTKSSMGSKIKINIKNMEKSSSIENNDEDDEDDEDDEYIEHPSIEPIIAQNSNVNKIIKINVKKKMEGTTTYKSAILDQIPVKKAHVEPIILSGTIHLESFYDDGQIYFIDWKSKYIFPPNEESKSFSSLDPHQPIGKVIDTEPDPDEFKEGFYPLIKRKIEWFYHYPLDVDLQ